MRFHVIEVGALCYSASFLAFYFLSQDWGGFTFLARIEEVDEGDRLEWLLLPSFLLWTDLRKMNHYNILEYIYIGDISCVSKWLMAWFDKADLWGSLKRFVSRFEVQHAQQKWRVQLMKCYQQVMVNLGPRWPKWLILRRIVMILVVHWNSSKRFPLAGRARENNLLNEVFMQWLWVYLPLWMQGLMLH